MTRRPSASDASNGADTLTGANGNDTVDISNGADTIIGANGNDTIKSADAADTLDAGDTEDVVAPTGDKKWDSVVLIVGNAPFKDTLRRPVIVVQGSERVDRNDVASGEAPYGTYRNPSQAPLVQLEYGAGADVYFAVDAVDFGEGRTPVVRVGTEVQQTGFSGFDEKEGRVHVGPTSAVFAAVNYAYTRGARRIEIIGLSPEAIEKHGPWFAEVADKVQISYGG